MQGGGITKGGSVTNSYQQIFFFFLVFDRVRIGVQMIWDNIKLEVFLIVWGEVYRSIPRAVSGQPELIQIDGRHLFSFPTFYPHSVLRRSLTIAKDIQSKKNKYFYCDHVDLYLKNGIQCLPLYGDRIWACLYAY